MLFLLGVLAILQVTILPGAALLWYLKPKGLNPIEQAVGAFACSLILNCVLVTTLTLAHMQTPAVWLVLIALEAGYLATGLAAWSRAWSFSVKEINRVKFLSWEVSIAGILLLAALVILLALVRGNWGSVYVGNDDVANWDRWATEWAAGHFPTTTSLYPQLIPTNGSISYVLIQNIDIKMFSKAVTPLYTLATVLLFLSLALRRRDPAYLLGGTLYPVMVLVYMFPRFMTYGYADLPLAFFAFLSFYCITVAPGRPHRFAVLAMLFFSLGTLLAKQGGIYAVIAALVYAALWTYRKKKTPDDGGALLRNDQPTWILIALAVFSAAWYLGKFVQIRLGLDYSNITLLTQDLHYGRNYYQRVLAICDKFLHQDPINPVLTVPLWILLAASLLFRRTRVITACLVLPFLTAYAFWFSYEIRTSLMAFPFVALVCAGALYEILLRLRPFLTPFRVAMIVVAVIGLLLHPPDRLEHVLLNPVITRTLWAFLNPVLAFCFVGLALSFVDLKATFRVPVGALGVSAVAALVAWGALTQPADVILAQQIDRARHTIGDPAIADGLYKAVSERHITSGIATYYWFLRGLPGIRQQFRQLGECRPCSPKLIEDELRRYPGVNYVLIPDTAISSASKQALAQDPRFDTVFDLSGWRLMGYHP